MHSHLSVSPLSRSPRTCYEIALRVSVPKAAMTYFKPKKVGGLDDDMAVTLTSGVQLPATVRTVGDLRRLTVWPTKHRLVIERHPVIKVRVELGHAAHHA